jgi:hypothetical protein
VPIPPADPRFAAHPRFDLAGAKACQEALTRAKAEWEAAGGFQGPDVLLSAEMQPGGSIVFRWPDGSLVGKISGSHRLARAVAAGQGIARVKVCNLSIDRTKDSLIILRAEAWTGPPGEIYVPPPPREYVYKTGLVGEQHHRAAVQRCRVGEAVTLMHEQGNPHDPKALAAFSAQGQRIGYIAQDHWLRRAVMEDGQGCSAAIISVAPGQRGFQQIVLEVRLGGPPVKAVAWSGDAGASLAEADQQSSAVMAAVVIAVLFMLLLVSMAQTNK